MGAGGASDSGCMQSRMPVDEAHMLKTFWAYTQPVEYYNQLAKRSDENPLYLARTFCRSPEQLQRPKSDGVLVEVTGPPSAQPLSVVAVLCRRNSDADYLPLSAAMLHYPPIGSNDAATVELALPPQHAEGEALDAQLERLVVLLLVRDGFRDLRFLKRHGAPLSCDLDTNWLCGMLPVRGTVLWACVPLLRANGIANGSSQVQQLVKLSRAEISVQPGSEESGTSPGSVSTLRLSPTAANACPDTDVDMQLQVYCKLSMAANGTGSSRWTSCSVERSVYWKYFYAEGKRHFSESMAGNRCAFCHMHCHSFLALSAHLELSHSRFVFKFSEDHPGVVPQIYIEVGDDAHALPTGKHSSPASAAWHTHDKTFSHYMPPAARQKRLAAFEQHLRRRSGLHTHKLVQSKTGALQPAAEESADLNAEQSAMQRRLKSQHHLKRGARKLKKEASFAAEPPRPTYFHSRNCASCTPAEVDADSDNENDDDEWERRARRKLIERVDLETTQAEFVLNWNSWVYKNPIHSDAITQSVCDLFARDLAEPFREMPAVRALLLEHLTLHWHYGLIESTTFDAILRLVQPQPTDLAAGAGAADPQALELDETS